MLRQQGWSLKRAPSFQACDHSVARTRTLTRPSQRDIRSYIVLKPVVNDDELVPVRDCVRVESQWNAQF